MRFWTIFWRSCRLRCPLCGKEKLFTGLFRMRSHCPACGTLIQRESGFFLGSIYFNYGLTALITAIAYPLLSVTRTVPEQPLRIGLLLFALVFPLWFFRYARSLWLGFDQYFDPRQGERLD